MRALLHSLLVAKGTIRPIGMHVTLTLYFINAYNTPTSMSSTRVGPDLREYCSYRVRIACGSMGFQPALQHICFKISHWMPLWVQTLCACILFRRELIHTYVGHQNIPLCRFKAWKQRQNVYIILYINSAYTAELCDKVPRMQIKWTRHRQTRIEVVEEIRKLVLSTFDRWSAQPR